MDFKRLARAVLERLAPIYIATVLWGVTGYGAFMIGGVALSLLLEIAWPLLRPLGEVVYEELRAQHAQIQARRRTALLQDFLPFLQAYTAVLTAYPPGLLTASAAEVSAQLDTCAEVIRQVKARCAPAPEDPFEPRCEDAYEIVRTASLSTRDFRDWRLQDCLAWRQALLAILARGRITPLRHAVHHAARGRPRQVWEACLAEAAHLLEREAEQKLRQWHCIRRAQVDPAVRRQLTVLLHLDPINRQASLQPYLASRQMQCPPAEVREVMAYIRYDPVAAKVLALVEAPCQSATLQ